MEEQTIEKLTRQLHKMNQNHQELLFLQKMQHSQKKVNGNFNFKPNFKVKMQSKRESSFYKPVNNTMVSVLEEESTKHTLKPRGDVLKINVSIQYLDKAITMSDIKLLKGIQIQELHKEIVKIMPKPEAKADYLQESYLEINDKVWSPTTFIGEIENIESAVFNLHVNNKYYNSK